MGTTDGGVEPPRRETKKMPRQTVESLIEKGTVGTRKISVNCFCDSLVLGKNVRKQYCGEHNIINQSRGHNRFLVGPETQPGLGVTLLTTDILNSVPYQI